MRKMTAGLIVAALVAACVGVAVAADLATITKNDATPNGLQKFADKVNSNFTLIAAGVITNSQARLDLSVTNATAATTITKQTGAVTATAAVTAEVDAFVKTITLQTVSLTDTNGVTGLCVTGLVLTTGSAYTNASVAVTVVGGGAVVTNATAATTLTLQR